MGTRVTFYHYGKLMNDILQKILITKQAEVIAAKIHISPKKIKQQALQAPAPRDFIAAIKQQHQLGKPAIIAEIKKASPSKGVIRNHFHPAEIAQAYAKNGAACLSVLTDKTYFQGAAEYLQQARAACNLPVLRKDFIIDEYQIYEARSWGADAILLIAAALDSLQIVKFEAIAHQLGMAVLIEVHDAAEIKKCAAATTCLFGINNRNLRTFAVDLQITLELSKKLIDKIVVTESGIQTKEEIKNMQSHDINTFLIGESLMRQADIGMALHSLYA